MQEQTAPGTRTMHIKDGWNFGRLPDGRVRIYQTDLNAPEHSDNAPLAEIVISDSEWQSIIAGMSAYEDSAEAFAIADAFHGGRIHRWDDG